MSSLKQEKGMHIQLKTYVIGFVLSLIATVSAYSLVVQNHYTKPALLALISVLAVAQFVVQVVFFLHLGHEKSPRWRLVAFGFMILFVLIIVIGSLWIMDNLNYHMLTTPNGVNKYLHSQDGI